MNGAQRGDQRSKFGDRGLARLAVLGWAYARCDWYCCWSLVLRLEGRCTFAAWDQDGRIVLIAAVTGSIAADIVEVHRVFFRDPKLAPLDDAALPVKVRFRA